MKKPLISLILALVLGVSLVPAALAADSDLTIVDGVLTVYTGPGGDVVIPSSVTSIGSYAFKDCAGLTSIVIPDSVTSIGDCAFQYCTGLTNITIGSGVTAIGDYTFDSCFSLTEINVAADNTVYCSEDGVVFSKDKKVLVVCPAGKAGAYTIPDHVTTIGRAAFWCCLDLTAITIPDSVTTIGDEAFWDCQGLIRITIPDSITAIGNGMFHACLNLADITIPSNVTYIGDQAFEFCYGLTSVTIPDSVTTIGNYAFYNCQGLASIAIPGSVTSIGNSAFKECAGLTDVYYSGSLAQWAAMTDGAVLDPSAQLHTSTYFAKEGALLSGVLGPENRELAWSYANGTLRFASPTPEGGTVLIGRYGEGGAFLGTQCVTADRLTAHIGAAETFKLFYLDENHAPQSEAVTVHN